MHTCEGWLIFTRYRNKDGEEYCLIVFTERGRIVRWLKGKHPFSVPKDGVEWGLGAQRRKGVAEENYTLSSDFHSTGKIKLQT